MDHAGIATQNVVERQLAEEGLRREDLAARSSSNACGPGRPFGRSNHQSAQEARLLLRLGQAAVHMDEGFPALSARCSSGSMKRA